MCSNEPHPWIVSFLLHKGGHDLCWDYRENTVLIFLETFNMIKQKHREERRLEERKAK